MWTLKYIELLAIDPTYGGGPSYFMRPRTIEFNDIKQEDHVGATKKAFEFISNKHNIVPTAEIELSWVLIHEYAKNPFVAELAKRCQ